MSSKKIISVFLVGIALFSMFFGGGNLTFPLWSGIQSESLLSTTLGFLISGVIIPFYGIMIGLYFKGDYKKCLGVFGKPIAHLLIFSLLFFWIPLGSGPRCNQLAYGAFNQMGISAPFWLYSGIYSIAVFFLTYKKNRILDILGNFITPILLVSLIFFVYLGYVNAGNNIQHASFDWSEFGKSFSSGYNTMDFIATIFFTSTIISLIKAKGKGTFNIKHVYYSCFIAIFMLSVVYIGMIFVGKLNADLLSNISRDQLLAFLGKSVFQEKYHALLFSVITLSCLTTSVALALVFSDYLRETVFNNKIGYKGCLAISIFVSFLLSIIGFEPLAAIIAWAMSILYPVLLVTTTVSLGKSLYVDYFKADKKELSLSLH